MRAGRLAMNRGTSGRVEEGMTKAEKARAREWQSICRAKIWSWGRGGLRGIARLAAGYTVSRPTTQLVDRHGAAENV